MLASILYLIALIGYSLPDNTVAASIPYVVQQTVKQKLGYGKTTNHGMLKVQIPIFETALVLILALDIFRIMLEIQTGS